MQKQIILYIFLSLLFSTCSMDIGNNNINNNNNASITPTLKMENGVIVSVPCFWKRSLHKNQPSSNSIIDAHLVYNGNPIIATTEGVDDRWINLVDIETGEDIWKWSDAYEAPTEKFSIKDAYIHNNLMTYQVGTRSYCINLDDGTTHWKYRGDISFMYKLSGIDDSYFLLAPGRDTLQGYFNYLGFRANISDGQVKEEFLYTDIKVNYTYTPPRATSIGLIKPHKHNDGKNYLIVASGDSYPDWNANLFIGLYDYDNEQWVYNRKMVNEPSQNSGVTDFIVINDKIYFDGGRNMNCHDLWTGERIWKSPMSSILMFSNFVVEKGKIIAADEDEIVYCWDAETGAELWRAPGAGTSSELRYLNGIVYFSGGSTGRIHGIDIETGKTVWLLKPELMDGTDDFKPDIYAIEGKNGEKGKLVICTHTNAFCVEAYQ